VSRGLCFAAGTPVLTPGGEKAIEDIKPGDIVWSHDDATGKTSKQQVIQTFVTKDQPIFNVALDDNADHSELIRTTGEHPFWVARQGWTPAHKLRSGDRVFRLSGGWLRVGSATWAQKRETVYNFEVAHTHSYFVGTLGAWVHNSCWESVAEHVAHRFPGKSKAQIIGYLERFSSSVKGVETASGATIWRKGTEFLVRRPPNGGSYFFANSKAEALRYLENFFLDNGGPLL
jgi:Pretoxin HINT domain